MLFVQTLYSRKANHFWTNLVILNYKVPIIHHHLSNPSSTLMFLPPPIHHFLWLICQLYLVYWTVLWTPILTSWRGKLEWKMERITQKSALSILLWLQAEDSIESDRGFLLIWQTRRRCKIRAEVKRTLPCETKSLASVVLLLRSSLELQLGSTIEWRLTNPKHN